jgi:hypothetical protein
MAMTGRGDRSDYLVFISHASKDRWIAKQIAAIIERKAKRLGADLSR